MFAACKQCDSVAKLLLLQPGAMKSSAAAAPSGDAVKAAAVTL